MIKQTIVIRKDLKMRRGKEIAQGSHASMAFLTKTIQRKYQEYTQHTPKYNQEFDAYRNNIGFLLQFSPEVLTWCEKYFTKVCLQVNSEEELLDIYNKAKEAGLEVHIIEDEGVTEFHNVKTKTCLAIGPNKSEDIDKITSHLELY